jgi:hypothetical protein
MTARSKIIGNRWESNVLNKYLDAGFQAKKTYQPAQSAGLDPGDIYLTGPQGEVIKVEVKYRRTGAGFKTLRKWIYKKDHLILCEPYVEPLVVLRFEDYIQLLGANNDRNSSMERIK